MSVLSVTVRVTSPLALLFTTMPVLLSETTLPVTFLYFGFASVFSAARVACVSTNRARMNSAAALIFFIFFHLLSSCDDFRFHLAFHEIEDFLDPRLKADHGPLDRYILVP